MVPTPGCVEEVVADPASEDLDASVRKTATAVCKCSHFVENGKFSGCRRLCAATSFAGPGERRFHVFDNLIFRQVSPFIVSTGSIEVELVRVLKVIRGLVVESFAMDAKCGGESFEGGEQAFLEGANYERCCSLLSASGLGEALLAKIPVFVEEAHQL